MYGTYLIELENGDCVFIRKTKNNKTAEILANTELWDLVQSRSITLITPYPHQIADKKSISLSSLRRDDENKTDLNNLSLSLQSRAIAAKKR